MKKQIRSAELERYNANSRGNRSADCVKRAISLAFDKSYNEVSKLLNAQMKEMRWDAWNRLPVFKRVIADLGGGEATEMKESVTVNDFADSRDPSNIYIVLCGKKLGDVSHLVTIRDGKVWDSWDSRNYIVTRYWTVSGQDRKKVRDTDKRYMNNIAFDYAQPIVQKEIVAYTDKKGLARDYYSTEIATSSYQIVVRCALKLAPTDIIEKARLYKFKISLTIEPTWTEPEIIEFVQKTAKQRTYDRLWAINEEEKKVKEAAEVAKMQTSGTSTSTIDEMWMTSQEKKFYNSLPGWAKPLVRGMRIYKPGQYYNSYVLQLNKLPGDNLESHQGKRYYNFETWTADEMRNILYEYKDTGRVEGIDYYYEEEF